MAANIETDLDSEKLEVADTRPAMMFGVPQELATMIIFAGLAIINQSKSIIVGIIPAAICWGIASFLVRKDYNAVGIVLVHIRSVLFIRDARLFGGSSISPFPVKRTKHFRGIFTDECN